MATALLDLDLPIPAAEAWAAVRDFGAVHERLVPGFLTGAELDGDVRTVTFHNGMVVREHLVTLDDEHRRLVYWNELPGAEHHSASVRVHESAAGCRIEWTTDVRPDALAEPIAEMMRAGLAVMAATLAPA